MVSACFPWGKRDAEEWSVFQTTNSGLSHNRITALALDISSRLWVASGAGVAWTHDGSEWWSDSAIDGPVSDILTGGDGSIWFNLGERVGRYMPCRWSTYDGNAIGVKATSFAAIALDTAGRLWAGGEGGVAMLEPPGSQGKWARMAIEQPVHAIAPVGEELWLEAGGAAARYAPATGESSLFLPEYGLGSSGAIHHHRRRGPGLVRDVGTWDHGAGWDRLGGLHDAELVPALELRQRRTICAGTVGCYSGPPQDWCRSRAATGTPTAPASLTFLMP